MGENTGGGGSRPILYAHPAGVAMRRRKVWVSSFCLLYITFQLFMIVRSHFTPSKHFGFWMFPESTYFRASLSRVLTDGQEVKARKGLWTVTTESGEVRYKWKAFVQGYRMDELDDKVRSKGTFADTLKYFQAALDYVADRIPEDKSTSQLVLRIRYYRAGGPEEVIILKSKPRLPGGTSSGTT